MCGCLRQRGRRTGRGRRDQGARVRRGRSRALPAPRARLHARAGRRRRPGWATCSRTECATSASSSTRGTRRLGRHRLRSRGREKPRRGPPTIGPRRAHRPRTLGACPACRGPIQPGDRQADLPQLARSSGMSRPSFRSSGSPTARTTTARARRTGAARPLVVADSRQTFSAGATPERRPTPSPAARSRVETRAVRSRKTGIP